MSIWPTLLQRPAKARDDRAIASWFTAFATRLLNGSRLVVGGKEHRFVEVEFYSSADDHPDPFTHHDPLQLQCGRWYFHKSQGVYRSGSFKGLDLTFGDGQAHGGVLIRGIETSDGKLIDGPSLCVDHLLDATGAGNVAALDRAIAGRVAWDPGNPLRLREKDSLDDRPLFRTGRVGLSLKKMKRSPEPPRFILRPYRYLSEPRRTSKGKLQLILALHAQGKSNEEIRQLTGSTKAVLERYLAAFEAGRQVTDFSPYVGKDLSPADLARLHGTWDARFGSE
jgi:hypothetical protein